MNDKGRNRVLVTGGAGFIGSALIWELNERGIDNILVSDYLRNDERFKNLIPLRFEDYIEGDDLLKNIEKSDTFYGNISTVYHLGACSSTTEKDCRYLIKNNYAYTCALAEWSLRQRLRFVYASSAATYGNGNQGMEDTDEENLTALRPLNMYGYSKHLFDLYAYKKGFLRELIGLKYFNIFGPNEGHKGDMRSVINKAFYQIKETGKLKLFKSYRPEYRDGEQMRDFLYVKDAVKMTLHLAETVSLKKGGLFNIGSGEARTWLELGEACFKAMGMPSDIEFIEMPEGLRAKYQYYTCANIGKLLETGYKEEITPLEAAIEEYIQYYLIPENQLGDVKICHC